jgi:hypothetical protein
MYNGIVGRVIISELNKFQQREKEREGGGGLIDCLSPPLQQVVIKKSFQQVSNEPIRVLS